MSPHIREKLILLRAQLIMQDTIKRQLAKANEAASIAQDIERNRRATETWQQLKAATHQLASKYKE